VATTRSVYLKSWSSDLDPKDHAKYQFMQFMVQSRRSVSNPTAEEHPYPFVVAIFVKSPSVFGKPTRGPQKLYSVS
jgi:hypothetical protein